MPDPQNPGDKPPSRGLPIREFLKQDIALPGRRISTATPQPPVTALSPEERLTQQERANFLENYIHEVTAEMDELMQGHNYPQEIKALRYRLALLEKSDDGGFRSRVDLVREELTALESEYELLKPRLDALERERRYYRAQAAG